jgi:uroporphyrinogen decarboxylase
MFHSDGDLMSVLDDLVAVGVDILNPIETTAGMDVPEIRRRHPRLVLAGGIDVSQLLPFGTPQDVSRETRKLIEVAGPGIMVGSSTELHNDVPLGNFRAMAETVWDYRY